MDKPMYEDKYYNMHKWRSDGTEYDWCIHGYCSAGGYGWQMDGGNVDHSLGFNTGTEGVPVFEGPSKTGGLVCMLKRQYHLCLI